MKTLLAALCTTLVVAGLVSHWGLAESIEPPDPAAAWEAEPGQEPLELDKCRLELLKSKVIVIGASQSGVLDDVEPSEKGQMVVADAEVAKIRDKVIQERLKAAEKRVASDVEIRYARASNQLAAAKHKKALAAGSYSDAEMMELALDKEKTLLQIEKAENDRILQGLERGEISAEIATYQMTTPISGEVTQVMKHRGESVRLGDDIMEITDLSEIRAVGQVPTSYLSEVKKGMQVRVRLKVPDGAKQPPSDDVFAGKIIHIEPNVSRVNQTLDVHAIIQNKADKNGNFKLRQGMASRMAIMLPAVPVRGALKPRARR